MRNDPRIRQTLNQLSQNLEAANQTTQASLFTFSQTYVHPCLASFNACLEASCQPCFAARDDRQHRRRPSRSTRRGRENLAFDFYDDWDQEESEWGNDELDRLLAGSEGQPRKHGGMNYGSRGGVGMRKGTGMASKDADDPNMVPQSSMFGFLERLPWKIGGRGARYKPNVANLQSNIGKRAQEAEPLLNESDEEQRRGRHGRTRSETMGSRSTTNSLSSRGDLFPSDDEADAIPIDDEFAMALERRTTGTRSDDHSSGKGGGKQPSASRSSTKTTSSRDSKSVHNAVRGTSASSGKVPKKSQVDAGHIPSMTDSKQEDEGMRRQEEAEVERRRQGTPQLYSERIREQEHQVSTRFAPPLSVVIERKVGTSGT